MAENSLIEPSSELLDKLLTPGGQFVIKAIVRETTEHSVKKTLEALGFDIDEPTEVQQDVATMREVRKMLSDFEYQKDMLHLRQWRVAMGDLKSKGILVSVGFAILGVIALVVLGFKSKLAVLGL